MATPVVALITYLNIVKGPGKLSVIPEGYEPKEYEYERHPLTRLVIKMNMFKSQQEIHELRLHYVSLFVLHAIELVNFNKLKIFTFSCGNWLWKTEEISLWLR